jgi:hypothetical protein
MRAVDFAVLFMLIIMLTLGLSFFWYNLQSDTATYEPYQENLSLPSLSFTSSQFYPNMRFASKEISFSFEPSCNLQKRTEVTNAFFILSEKTVLKFTQIQDIGDIYVKCSGEAPDEIVKKENGKEYYVAGEGGPTEALNLTNGYYLIKKGKIVLFRNEKCQQPQLATHEILHVLGFDHSSNTQSIMYPVTNCEQTLDYDIIEQIRKVYEKPSLPDVVIEYVNASTSFSGLSFYLVVTNIGFVEANKINVEVFAGNTKVINYSLGTILPGVKKTLEVQHVHVPRKSNLLVFSISADQKELTLTNNRAELYSTPEKANSS